MFGEVTEGMDIVDKVNQTFVDKDFIPLQDIRFVPEGCGQLSLWGFSE